MTPTAIKENDFPYGGTRAAYMLKLGLDRAKQERGVSIRTLGKRLGYRQATVLSHMASGRVPVPFERAPEMARQLDLNVAEFLVAILEQRMPEAGDVLLPYISCAPRTTGWLHELETVAGTTLDALPDEHRAVLMEVVSDRAPRRRWLSLAELAIVTEMRRSNGTPNHKK
jgi:hypothetical protein